MPRQVRRYARTRDRHHDYCAVRACRARSLRLINWKRCTDDDGGGPRQIRNLLFPTRRGGTCWRRPALRGGGARPITRIDIDEKLVLHNTRELSSSWSSSSARTTIPDLVTGASAKGSRRTWRKTRTRTGTTLPAADSGWGGRERGSVGGGVW